MMSVKKRVKKVLWETLYPTHVAKRSRDLKRSMRLYLDLAADSLDKMEMVMALEEEFLREVPDAIAMKWVTVGDVVDYFESVVTTDE